MLKVVLLFVLAFGFVACDEDDIAELVKGDPIALPAGYYESQCVVGETAGTSYISIVKVVVQTEVELATEDFLTEDCTGGSVTTALTATPIAVADFSFANQLSFFEFTDDDEYVAYYIEDDVVYVSARKEDINENNVVSSFSDFAENPKENAEFEYSPATEPAS